MATVTKLRFHPVKDAPGFFVLYTYSGDSTFGVLLTEKQSNELIGMIHDGIAESHRIRDSG